MTPPRARGRPLDPVRPWPTFAEQSRRIVRLLVFIGVLSFVISGIENLPDRPLVWAAWWTGAFAAGVATYRVETYLARRRGWEGR